MRRQDTHRLCAVASSLAFLCCQKAHVCTVVAVGDTVWCTVTAACCDGGISPVLLAHTLLIGCTYDFGVCRGTAGGWGAPEVSSNWMDACKFWVLQCRLLVLCTCFFATLHTHTHLQVAADPPGVVHASQSSPLFAQTWLLPRRPLVPLTAA